MLCAVDCCVMHWRMMSCNTMYHGALCCCMVGFDRELSSLVWYGLVLSSRVAIGSVGFHTVSYWLLWCCLHLCALLCGAVVCFVVVYCSVL